MIAALGFALATLVQFTGLVNIPGIPPAGLVGGLVVACILVLVLGDYSRKPAFRVRRTSTSVDSPDAGSTVNRPAGQGPDWTYTTRSKLVTFSAIVSRPNCGRVPYTGSSRPYPTPCSP